MEYTHILNSIEHLGFRSFVKKAFECGITVQTYPQHKTLFRFTYKNDTVYCNKYRFPFTYGSGRLFTNKDITKIILNENGINTPRGIVFHSIDDIDSEKIFTQLSVPLILKPTDGSLAYGLTRNICSPKDLQNAIKNFLHARKSHPKVVKTPSVMIEETAQGDEYRVLVLNNKVVSCVKKIPPTVIGDGRSTIEELITIQNQKRLKEFPILIDDVVLRNLSIKKLTLQSVLPKDGSVILRPDVMVGMGARTVECRTHMHPSLQEKCARAVSLVGLEFGGIDLIAQDIGQENSYKILEINSKPVYVINEKPIAEGEGTMDISLLLWQNIFSNLK